MELSEAPHIIEAILFVSGEAVSVPDLAQALGLSEMETMHAVELLQHPDGDQIRQRLTAVGSIYTPVMLEELAQQEPPQATPVFDNLH